MLALNPPLAALHGARLDHTGAVAHGFINSVEHLVAATLRFNNYIIDRLTVHARTQARTVPPLVAIDVATDPAIQIMGAGIFQEQMHLAADLSTRWVALGEWHQHGFNALVSGWLAHVEKSFPVPPAAAGVAALQKAIESADHAVTDVAGIAVETTERVLQQADRTQAAVRPHKRSGKQQ
ncbi:MAG: hypothetical protein WC023_06865 [Rhodocyclaceae bacterium]|jgi:hypothetical protein